MAKFKNDLYLVTKRDDMVDVFVTGRRLELRVTHDESINIQLTPTEARSIARGLHRAARAASKR